MKYLLLLLFTSIIGVSFAQTGPGGYGTTDGTSNLVLWLRADAGVNTSGSFVNSWADQSGYGYDANAPANPRRPEFIASDANFDGEPSILFDEGNTEWMFIEDDGDEAPFLDNTSELSVFYVYRPNNGSGFRAHLSKRDGNGSQMSYVFYESSNQNSRINANNDAGASISANTVYINALTYDAGNFNHWLNQTSGGGVSGGTASIPNNDSDLNIGEFQSGDGRTFDGRMTEIIIFRQFLTDAERIVVESYLASKYGITLSDDHWDEATYATYDNEIAGIGQDDIGSIADAATSAIVSISGGTGRDNGEWFFWGHDTGDITGYGSYEGVINRLQREWVVNETGQLGLVDISIPESELPSTGIASPNYNLIVDTDGDGDFSTGTIDSYSLTLNGGNLEASVDLDEGDVFTVSFDAPEPAGISLPLAFWLDSDSGPENGSSNPAIDGESVVTWQDLSTNDADGINGTSPTFNSTSPVNFRPTVGFNAASSEYLEVDLSALDASDFTVMSVVRRASSSANQGILGDETTPAGDSLAIVYGTNTTLSGQTSVSESTGNTAVNGFNNPETTPSLVVLDYESSASLLSIQELRDGSASFASNTSMATGYNPGSVPTGNLGRVAGSNYFDGDIAEMVVFPSSLTGNDSTGLISNLAIQYGISLNNDYTDETGTVLWDYSVSNADGFVNDVTAIGFDESFNLNQKVSKSATDSVVLTTSVDFSALNSDVSRPSLSDGQFIFIANDNDPYNLDQTFNGLANSRLDRTWRVDEIGTPGNVVIAIPKAVGSLNFMLVTTNDDFTTAPVEQVSLLESGDYYYATHDFNDGDYFSFAFDDTEIWYSYRTGVWSDWTNWTLDGAVSALLVNPDMKIPLPGDSVVIKSGKSITVDVQDISIESMEINGILDIANTGGHDFNYIFGFGKLEMAGNGGLDNYPAGVDTLFSDFDEGGTVELYGSGLELNQNRTFRNLIVNMDTDTDVAIMTASSITLTKDLTVTQGDFQINDNASTTDLTLRVEGDILVESNGSILTGSGTARHELDLFGDFTNQGLVELTNRTSPGYTSEATDGIVDLNFKSGEQDQALTLENVARLYRIEIDKGVDDSYIVDITADDPSFFNLLGFANQSHPEDNQLVSSLDENINALGLYFGTVKLGENVDIPRLNGGGNYNVSEGAQIWVDGGSVAKTSGTAIVPYGTIRVSAGTLDAPINSGITTRGNATLIIEGGTVSVRQFRTSVFGATNQGGLVMTGGVFNVTGSGGTNNDYAIFNLTYEGNVFNVSGGDINISGPNAKGGIFIGSDPENISTTGGTVNFISNNANDFVIASRGSFYNLTMEATSGSAGDFIIDALTTGSGGAADRTVSGDELNLEIVNDLSILDSGSGTIFDANGYDVNITGTLALESGSTMTMVNNTLTFDGEGTSFIDIGTTGPLGLDSLVIDKDLDFDLVRVTNGPDRAITIANYFNHNSGRFDYLADTIVLNGNLIVSDTIGLDSSTGEFLMEGSSLQTITSNDGFIYDLVSNNVGDSLSGDLVVDSLVLNGGVFNISDNELIIMSDISTNNTFSSALMVETLGKASDGGIIWYFDDTADPPSVVYPLGSNAKYTPAEVDLVNVIDDGFVQVNPVDKELATTDLTAGAIIDYYWRVRNSGFTALPDVTLLNFTADPADYTGTANVALGKTATQSSTYNGRQASTAVDGNTSGNGEALVSHTQNDTEAYWDVDLGAIYDISSISIYNRTDCCGGRLQNYYVFVSDVPFVGTTVAASQGQAGVVEFFEAAQAGSPTTITTGAITGRYVRVQLQGTNFLHMAEVEVMGTINSSAFVPGGVEDGVDSDDSPASDTDFNRFYETNGFTAPNITFDGEFSDGTVQPFQLRTANYTAGDMGRFVGSPEIFYTNVPGDGFIIKWDNGANWTFAPNDIDGNSTIDSYELHDTRQPSAGDYPQRGDVAVIGWVPFGDPGGTDGEPHGISADDITVEFAELIFNQMLDANDGNPTERVYAYNFQFRPTLNINSGAGGFSSSGAVSGEGLFWLRSDGGGPTNQADPDFSAVDIGDFVRQDSSYLVYESTSNNFVYDNVPEEVPNILLSGDGWGAVDRDFEISTDLVVNQNMELLGDVNLVLSSGSTGDITVNQDLRIFRSTANGNDSGGFGRIDYPNDASRTIEVLGDLVLENEGAIVQVISPDNTQVESALIVHGDIIQDVTSGGGLQLSTAQDEDYIHLTLTGEGNHSLTVLSGSDPIFHNITINKGSDTTSTFTMLPDFTINGDNTIQPQSIELLAGKFILDNAGINVELADNSEFLIPSGSGLEITQGTVTTANGASINLDGLIRINGGTATLNNTDIIYSNTGQALIDVSSGILTVGNQIRRPITSSSGILKYRQTGGTVLIGADGQSENGRAMFEVLNTGSEFTLNGGDFTIRRGVTGDANPSLELLPETFDLTGSTITLGDASTPAVGGANFFNIKSEIALNNLTIFTDADFPVARALSLPLTIDGTFEIQAEGDFDANGFAITLNGDIDNEGTYTNSENLTLFNAAGSQEIRGGGTYSIFDFTKRNTGTLNLNTLGSLFVQNDLRHEEGTIAIGSDTLGVQGDAYIESTVTNTPSDGFLAFNSTSNNQNLYGLANNTITLGKIRINNPLGVDITDGFGYNFDITEELALLEGVFNVGGSLVTIREGGFISGDLGGTAQSDFSINNMVQTNSSFVDNGLKIDYFTLGSDSTIFFPIGEQKYTPVAFNLLNGSEGGSLRIRPANERHPTIIEDDEAPDPQIVDADNVLQYYWIVEAEDVTNTSGSASFFYNQIDISTTAPYDTSNYVPARLLSNDVDWDKAYGPDSFNGLPNQTIDFTLSGLPASEITGDYTAGVGARDDGTTNMNGAIPNTIPQFYSYPAGDSASYDADIWSDQPTGGAAGDVTVAAGVGPIGGSVTIRSGDTILINVNNVRLYETVIEQGGVLIIDPANFGHRLGNVRGSGTIRLLGTGDLPAGEYSAFFDCNGGALDYAGAGSYSVLGSISQLRKVSFTGTGSRIMPSNILEVCDTLNVDGPTLTMNTGQTITVGEIATPNDLFWLQTGTVSLTNSTSLNVNGSVDFVGGSFTGSSGTTVNIYENLSRTNTTLDWNNTSVTFDGATAQVITGDYRSGRTFDNLTINNTSSTGVTLNGDVSVNGLLTFTDGHIYSSTQDSLTLTSSGSYTAAKSASHVKGPVIKNNIAASSNYQFPVGKSGRYAPIQIRQVVTGGDNWKGEYFLTNLNGTGSFDPNDPGSGYGALTGVADDMWRVESEGSNSAFIRLTYGSWHASSDQNDLRVAWWDSGETTPRWENQGGNPIVGNLVTGTVTSENAISFSSQDFTLGAASEEALPVEMLYLEAREDRGVVILDWATASEENNDYFEVQRSLDGRDWEVIGYVNGAGTTTVIQEYNFVDNKPFVGISYYKLRQVDYDGKFTYTDIVVAQVKLEDVNFNLYPNPVEDHFTIDISGMSAFENISYHLINLQGGIVSKGAITTSESGRVNQEFPFSTGHPAGIYILILESREHVIRHTIIKK